MTYRIDEICDMNKENISKKDDIQYIQYLDTANLTKGIINETQKFIVGVDKIPSRAKRKVKQNDILISTVRPNQRHYGIIKNRIENLIVSTGFAVLTPNSKIVDPEYLYWYLTQDSIVEYLQAIAESSTSAYPSIRPSVLGSLEIDLPPLNEQKAIANILTTLDEKIETNNQINEKLNEMAQALFKHWFVDFEFPNEDGRPYKSSGGEMVESELGYIPKNWEIVELNELIKVKHGYAFKSKDFTDKNTNLLVLTPGNFKVGGGFKNDKFKYLKKGVSFPEEYILSSGDLIITMTDLSRDGDTLGFPALVPNDKENLYLHNQRLGKVELKRNFSIAYLYQILCSTKYRWHILSTATGTTVKHTAPNRIEKFKVLVPQSHVLDEYDKIASTFLNRTENENGEIRLLYKIRETLLPRLMSGEIRVPIV